MTQGFTSTQPASHLMGTTILHLQGVYEQKLIGIGSAEWVLFAAKTQYASSERVIDDAFTQVVLAKAHELAARRESLPFGQLVRVHNHEPPEGAAVFAAYNVTHDRYAWWVINYGPNTGVGRPGGSIMHDQEGNSHTDGSWVNWPVHDDSSGARFHIHYADDDQGGIAGEFTG